MQYWRYTYGYTWPVGDNGCSTGDTHMDTRGQWVTVDAVLAIHIWIHVVSVVTVAAVLPIHIWTTVSSVVTVEAVLLIHIWIHGFSVVTVAAVLAIHIWIHVASG